MRLFAVIRFEAVIHEFDPHFNWRTTEYLAEHGFSEFWNWFDNFTWYPLGRVVGNTLFPGLMTTSTLLNWMLNYLGLKVSVLHCCVFFAGLTSLAAFLLTREVTERPEAGLFAALFIAICPSYISRSVAGSYDNEACAIFAIVFSFYAFTKAVKSGSTLAGLFSAFAFLYMVASWGGYIFVLNTIAIYMLLIFLIGRLTPRHFVAYSLFYVVSTILCLNIPFVNFQAVTSSEHLASHGVFLVMNALYGTQFLLDALCTEEEDGEDGVLLEEQGSDGESQKNSSTKASSTSTKERTTTTTTTTTTSKKRSAIVSRGRLLWVVLKAVALIVAGLFLALVAYLTVSGKTNWSGRSLSLLDPTYASKYIPIIASVSEHQPSVWSNYIMDLHVLPFLVPVGIYLVFSWASDASLLLGIYGVVAVYFSGMMIRLLLVLSAAACCLGGVAASEILSTLMPMLRRKSTWDGTRLFGWRLAGESAEVNAQDSFVEKAGEKQKASSMGKADVDTVGGDGKIVPGDTDENTEDGLESPSLSTSTTADGAGSGGLLSSTLRVLGKPFRTSTSLHEEKKRRAQQSTNGEEGRDTSFQLVSSTDDDHDDSTGVERKAINVDKANTSSGLYPATSIAASRNNYGLPNIKRRFFVPEEGYQISKLIVLLAIGFLFQLLKGFVEHCTWMSAMAYSSPSVVMSTQDREGNRIMQDDFREAYYWLRKNTHPKATVASWWDYGYQITSLANRTVVVDNNTWNNTHIATIGLMLASNERDAYKILERLDIDYVLVLSGGVARYTADDIAKFLWPVRIANGVYPEKVAEADFLSAHGGYVVDESAPTKFKESVMYKLCYYRMGEITGGQDLARNQPIGASMITLKYFTEAFTSENWIVRIYKVKSRPHNRLPYTANGK
ncbi:unnamed protein product [Amoebophrya sp. A25]|nr:unnamed protein product [Amoebophrya sp. A25]|eukprot:GSA25T00010910001.1